MNSIWSWSTPAAEFPTRSLILPRGAGNRRGRHAGTFVDHRCLRFESRCWSRRTGENVLPSSRTMSPAKPRRAGCSTPCRGRRCGFSMRRWIFLAGFPRDPQLDPRGGAAQHGGDRCAGCAVEPSVCHAWRSSFIRMVGTRAKVKGNVQFFFRRMLERSTDSR